MRTRSIMMFGAAALCAGAAAMLTSIITSVQPVPPPTTETREAPRSRVIVVASRNFVPGERIDGSMLRRIDWPTKQLPAGSFSTISQASGNGATRYALARISKGEPVLSSKLSRPGKRPSLLNQLEESKSAVTISINTVQGVAGFIQPNDRVDVLLTRKTGRADVAAAGGSGVYTDILLQNIRVLAIDQRQNRTQEAKPARAVTLEVDQIESQKLTLGSNVGTLSLALKNNVARSPTSNTRRVSLDDLPGPTRATDTGVQGAPSVVTIIRGTKSQRYGVLKELGTNRGTATHSIRRIEAKQGSEEQHQQPQQAAPVVEGFQAQRNPTGREQISAPRIPRPINARTPHTVQSWVARTTVTRTPRTNKEPAANAPSTRDSKK